MKKLLYIPAPIFLSGFLFFSSSLFSQTNLVFNSSFEQYDTCPIYTTSTIWQEPTGWSINVNSSDYFNVCAIPSSWVSVPNNGFGFQYPATGNAYCGLYGIARNLSMTDSREYLGCQLITPLIIRQKYFVTLKASLSSMWCAVNKLGVLFMNNNYFGNNVFIQQPPPLINNFAHIYSDSLITDTLGWTTISGSFIADSAYQYLLIGNFFDYANFDSALYVGNKCGAYYYVDDICVSTDSLTCNAQVGIDNYDFDNGILIYPSPFNTSAGVTISNNISFKNVSYIIYNVLGKEIRNKTIFNKSFIIERNDLSPGIYFLKFYFSGRTLIKKIIITN